VSLGVTEMCRKMARTGDNSSDSESDSEVAGRWHRPPPSDDECDDAITLKSHQLRSLQRDSNIVLNIRVMWTKHLNSNNNNNNMSDLGSVRIFCKLVLWRTWNLRQSLFPSKDSVSAVMIVCRLGGKVIRTVPGELCCVQQLCTHMCTFLKFACWFRFRFRSCVFV